jgi:hypothetical protein
MLSINMMDEEEEVTFDPNSPPFSELLQEIDNLEANINEELVRNQKIHELTLPYMEEIREKLEFFRLRRQKNVSLSLKD